MESRDTGDRYSRVRLLGEGGAGRVWLVEDSARPGRHLALKELAESSRSQASSLRREFAILANLRHPNLAEVFDFSLGPDSNLPRFSLEYIDGADFVRAAHGNGSELLFDLSAETLRALSFLHDFDLIHRDLKPANLLVRSRPRHGNRVVVLDFGLALQGRSGDSDNRPSGTLSYIAPELFDGAPATRRSDLYAFGIVLYEAIHGSAPFLLLDDGLAAFVASVQQGCSLPGLPSGFPAALNELLSDLIAPDPARRPASASETLARLNAACGAHYPGETVATRAARLRSGEPAGRQAELDAVRDALEERRTPRLVWLAGEAGSGKTRVLRWLNAEYVRKGWEVRSFTQQDLQMGELSTLRNLAAEKPTLLLVDEIEAAGESQIRLLDRVSREIDAEPLKVVAGIRSAEARQPMLRKLIADSDLLPTSRIVDLQPLNIESIQAIARRSGGGAEVSLGQAQWLFEASEGNPLIVESLLVEGAWERGGKAQEHPTLENSVAQRLDQLSSQGRTWIESVVVAGPGFPVGLADSLHGLSIEDAALAAAEASLLGLVVHETGSTCRPASRLVSKQLLEGMEPDRRQALYRQAVELLENESRAEDAGRLALLWRGAGDREKSLDCAIATAEAATEAENFTDAEAWYRFGLGLLSRSDIRRRELRIRHAEMLGKTGNHQAEARALATVLRLSREPSEVAGVLCKLARALRMVRRLDRALVVAERAKVLSSDCGLVAEQGKAALEIGSTTYMLGEVEPAIKILKTAVKDLDAAGQKVELIQALHNIAIAQSRLSRFPEARKGFRQALELASEIGDPGAQANAHLAMGILETRAWCLEDAAVHYENARAVVEQHDLAGHRSVLFSETAALAGNAGEFDRALRLVEEAESLALRMGNRVGYLVCRSVRGDSLIAAGRPGEAIEVLNEVLESPAFRSETRHLRFIRLTMAEALLAGPRPPHSKVKELLEEFFDGDVEEPRAALAALVVEMERRVRPECKEPFDPIWKRYLETLEQSKVEIEPPLTARAQLAHGQALLASSKIDLAADAARSVIALAKDKDLPAMEARAYGLLGEAQDRQGLRGEARGALEAGRQALDRAAGRIQDESLREDFLNRPVFRDLRSVSKAAAETEDRLLTIYEMIRVLNSELDPEPLLESMLDMALGIVQAERGMILLRDPSTGEYSVRVARNLEKETIEDAASFSRNVVLRAGSGRAVLAADVENDERLRDLKSVSLYGIRSVLCVPLESRQQIVGAVYLDSRSGGALFAEDDLRFLEAFADHAALALENARARQELELRNERLRVAAERRACYGDIIGGSAPMQRVYDLIGKVAENALPVLIQGESGTGKELVARAIHLRSPRSRKPFLTENCAAIAETLLESELFGHVKGAFTGADQDRAGLFERAHLGTLFLDEVGDMSPGMQARLLRVIQEGELRRVGGDRSIDVDVRLLVATHRDLQDLVGRGEFREDLFYRLQVLMVQLPPLRERAGDVSLLIEHFLDRISSERGRRTPAIHVSVSDLLERCAWPGNVRQLENTLQRLVLLAGDGPITLEVVESDRGLKESLIDLADAAQPVLSLRQNEEEKIRQALDAVGGNRLRAAKMLGVSRATIFRKIKQYGLS